MLSNVLTVIGIALVIPVAFLLSIFLFCCLKALIAKEIEDIDKETDELIEKLFKGKEEKENG